METNNTPAAEYAFGMTAPDWIVDRVRRGTSARYTVEGMNLSSGTRFFWLVECLTNDRYALADGVTDAETIAAFAAAKATPAPWKR